MKQTVIRIGFILLILIFALAPAQAKAQKTVYAAGDPNELGVTTFNPIKVELSHEAMYILFDRLIEWGLDGKFYPGLVESWSVSEDGMTWTMNLKKGVRFHDGSPFNSEVVKWFLKEMETGPSSYMVGAVDNVEITGPYSVLIHMKHPDPNMLYNFSQSFMCVPSMEAYKKYGEEFGIKYVVGSGPYKFESWSPGNELVLVKNPDYKWGPGHVKNKGPAVIDKVVYKDIKEESTRFLELKTGKLDVVFAVPTMFIDKIEKDKNLSIVQLPGLTLYHMIMNTQSPPLDNLLVRKGIALAVDQESITKNVFASAGKPAYTYLIDSLPSSKVDPKDEIRFDPEGAKAALDKAGWKMGPDGVRTDKDGNRLKLKMLAKNESSYRRSAEVIQAQLAAVGIETEINLMDPSSIRAFYKKGEHQLAVRSYEWDNADILEWFLNSKRLGYPNACMWHDNESDYLMQKAMTRSRTQEERIQNFKEYHTYVLNQVLWAPFYLPDKVFAVGKRLVYPKDSLDRRFMGMGVLDWDLK
ncbi:ABC transporter substrate-binding protein [Desulfospira joergensenii]|uniref:ABC transporter substrate-binding protein n=1 Tax=Desulfospira joergensenii TaxID=53329 RepID=UPI0003B46587|nr:ABC transporter substrate-binding protein [Desulfospira joergensenii]